MFSRLFDFLICGVVGYLVGSIPSGVLLARLFGWPDPRAYGSGHTGAMNVSRGAGKVALVIVMLVDMLKGLAAVLIVSELWANPWAITLAGIAAVAGHNWPVWLRFRGGMGLSTGAGAMITLAWPVVVVAAASLAAIRILLIRHTPRATIAASLTIPPALWLFDYPPQIFWLGTGIAVLIIVRHMSDWNRQYS
ncbi:MAG: glycerol-3-phosphate acyltransferase [Anaerolineae bacterium]|nr:glycerol-3-phosphate acyltransferase [Anaerolineae bacterium]